MTFATSQHFLSTKTIGISKHRKVVSKNQPLYHSSISPRRCHSKSINLKAFFAPTNPGRDEEGKI
jgi:hypothetical protein